MQYFHTTPISESNQGYQVEDPVSPGLLGNHTGPAEPDGSGSVQPQSFLPVHASTWHPLPLTFIYLGL